MLSPFWYWAFLRGKPLLQKLQGPPQKIRLDFFAGFSRPGGRSGAAAGAGGRRPPRGAMAPRPRRAVPASCTHRRSLYAANLFCIRWLPLITAESHTLILGTMPSPRSRAEAFYYAHPQNRFWPVIAALGGEEDPKTSEGRAELLLSHGLALWDVLASCTITGAAQHHPGASHPQ